MECRFIGRDSKGRAVGREGEGENGSGVDAAAQLSELCARGKGPQAYQRALLTSRSNKIARPAYPDCAQGAFVGRDDTDVARVQIVDLDLARRSTRECDNVRA